jgi:hypothetical protein
MAKEMTMTQGFSNLVAGYTTEAETFSKEINAELVAEGLDPMSGADKPPSPVATNRPASYRRSARTAVGRCPTRTEKMK